MFELIIATSLAIIISAVCSFFEAVLYSVPMRHIETLAQAGKSAGKIFKELRTNVARPIGAILCLNTIANTAGATVAGSAASTVFGHDCLLYFSAFFTVMILIFSEIIPKTAGVVYAKSFVPIVALPIKGLVWIMAPVIWLIGLITNMIASARVSETIITADELRVMAHLSFSSGEITPDQKDAIENILTLQEKTVRDVMTPRTVIFSLNEHLSLKEASMISDKWEHSRFPVYDNDAEDVVGVVFTKELFIELSRGNEDMRLTEFMRPVHFVVETASLNMVLIEFLKLRQHMFVALDEYGGLSGLITLEDIIEELLGREIVDESDEVEDKRDLARKRRTQVIGGSKSS